MKTDVSQIDTPENIGDLEDHKIQKENEASSVQRSYRPSYPKKVIKGFIDPIESPRVSFLMAEPTVSKIGTFQHDASENQRLHRIADKSYDAAFEAASLLLKYQAPLEAKNDQGETPLIQAAKEGNIKMVLLFLSKGAKVAVQDNNGYKPSQYKINYSCDHEREFLSSLQKLEENHLKDGFFSLSAIKNDLLTILRNEEFQSDSPQHALCGYIVNNVCENEKTAAFQFFKENCAFELAKDSNYLQFIPAEFFPRVEYRI